MTNTPDTATDRPLAVWPCANDALNRDKDDASVAIARRAIATYSEPGDLVVDPLCTDPKLPVVLEALRQDRHAAAVIGRDVDEFFELEERVSAARASGACSDAVLLRGDPRELPRLLTSQGDGLLRRRHDLQPGVRVHPGGSADLILTFLPAALLLGRNHQPTQRWQSRVGASDLLGAAAVVLRPGGYLVATTNDDVDGSGRDFSSETVSLCEELGLRYWQHVVALLVPIESSQLNAARAHRRTVESTSPRVVHQNVHVFRKPTAAETHAGNASLDARRAA